MDSAGGMTLVTLTINQGEPLGTTFAVNPENKWTYSHVADDAKSLMKDYLIAPGGGTNCANWLSPQASMGDTETRDARLA